MIDIQPSMDDNQVMDFVFKGYVVIEGVVSDTLNHQCKNLPRGGMSDFVRTDEFRRGVLLHPEVAGVVRSLLGHNFLVPTTAHLHLYFAPHTGQTWHSDGLTEPGYGVTHLQCYYYPQAVEIEDGPTMILPGSHSRLVDREAIAHYGDILGQVSLTVPAGTVALTHYGIWHKAGPKFNSRRRGMIKFSYFRTQPPKPDWVRESDEIPSYRQPNRHPYVTEVESYRDRRGCTRTWEWLCGRDETATDFNRVHLFSRGIPLNEIRL